MLSQASEYAASVDHLLAALAIFSVFICLAVSGMILYLSIRFRSGSPATRGRVPKLLGREIEVVWTAITAFAFLFLFWWALTGWLSAERLPAGALEVHVQAKQWMWKTRQPNGVREINALHVPMDQPIVLYLNSQDVIHSFYVPALRIKQDVVPGRTETLTFTANQSGAFDLYCAEYCGTSHSRMRGQVIVMAPDAYTRWLDSRPRGETLIDIGKALFTAAGCAGCHASRSSVHAPELTGLYGRRIALADGRLVTADDAYLRDSILLPRRDIVAGFEPVMPDFSQSLDDGEVSALVAYIRSLGDDK
ncbi:MAG: cytochrome c oxidase subunit II [Burkholderiaceae bacterium]